MSDRLYLSSFDIGVAGPDFADIPDADAFLSLLVYVDADSIATCIKRTEAIALRDKLSMWLGELGPPAPELKPGRWFRVLAPDGSLWMETSDGEEARTESTRTKWQLERLFVAEVSEWRPVGDAD